MAYKRKPRVPDSVKRPHFITLPKSVVNGGYFYGDGLYDIVKQEMSTWREKGSRTIRSAAPFVLKVSNGKKEYTIASKIKEIV